MARKFLALAFAVLLAGAAQAKYPDKSVRIVVPFAAGGVADITARIIAEKLGDRLGQRFYVENQPGAWRHCRGALGDLLPARRRDAGAHIERHRRQRLAVQEAAIRSAEGFCADLEFGLFRLHLCDFREYAVQDAVRLRRGCQGQARHAECRHHQCRQHAESFSAELFKTAAGIDFTIIPYRGTPEIQVALLQGDVGLMIDSFSSMAQSRRRQAEGAGFFRRASVRSDAGNRVRRRERRRRLRRRLLERAVCTQRHAARNHQDAERRVARNIGRCRHQEAIDRARHRGKGQHAEMFDRLKADIEKWAKVINNAGIQKQ